MKALSTLATGFAIALALLSGCATRTDSVAVAMPANCGVTSAQLQRIREINVDVVARGFAPGITTSIHCDGKPLLTASEGMADAARNRPMAANDLFRIIR